MHTPLQITFRDIASSPSLTAHVERRAEKLETIFDRIVDCQIVLEEPHRNHRHGKKFHVRIDLRVPGKELVISKNLEDSKEDLHAAIDDAFSDAERVLEDHVRVVRDGVPAGHLKPPHGVVARVFHDRGYGFIEADEDGHEIYFHKNSVLDGRFEKIIAGTKVRFAEEDGDNGPQASTVHILH